MGAHWIILRTSGARTLALAKSLADAGLDVWTPRQMQTRYKSRSSTKSEREMPIAPSFVFARADHLASLITIRAQPFSHHPPFSILHHAGRIPTIKDGSLDGLRSEEERFSMKARKERRRKLVMGQRVRFGQGAFAGMSGIVEDQRGQFAVVAFNDSFRVEVASWLIPEDGVQGDQAQLGAAA